MSVSLTGAPVLETERLILRAPEARDWEVCAPFMTSDRSLYMGGPYTRLEAWRSMGHVIGHWVLRGYGMFVLRPREKDVALGVVGPLYPEDRGEPEIGWSLWTKEAEGHGYAFEAARATLDFARTQLGWERPVSYIDSANTRSIALAERLGANRDLEAKAPDLPGWENTLVFRHGVEGAAL